MAFQTVFRRYELKYMLTVQHKDIIQQVMEPYMALDKYGRSTIRNIYLDTNNFRLIRRSIEKPAYKEKLRIRSYAQADYSSTVFVELKKKYDGVVYKRRIDLPQQQALNWICQRTTCPADTQISREIDYFIDFYGNVKPTVFLSYEREAYYDRSGEDFRITFDDQILFRQTDLSLMSPVYGTPILPQGMVLMELKCSGGIPLWMAEALSQEKIYKASFSKYGTAYEQLIFPHSMKQKERINNG